MHTRLSLRLRVFLFFALLGLGSVAVVLLGLGVGYRRLDSADPLQAFVVAGLVGSLGILGLVAWVWLLFDENVAKPILKLAGGLRTHAHSESAGEIDHAQARYLGDLGPAARALTANLAAAKTDVRSAIVKSTEDIVSEKSELQNLLAGVPAAIILCSADHRVIFYNGEAATLLHPDPPHLGRPLFESLRAEPVIAGFERLASAAETEFVCATLGSDQTLHVRMRRADAGRQAAYTLVLHSLGRKSKAFAAWPVTDFGASDLLRSLERGLGARKILVETACDDLRLVGDPLQLAALLGHLIDRLSSRGARSFSLLIRRSDDRAGLTLGWAGDAVDPSVTGDWLEEDLDPGSSYVSGLAVLELHGSTLDPVAPKAGRAALRLSAPLAKSDPAAPSLRAVFDFALANPPPESSDRLRDRVFVVFDTETTGLDPATDEIVQLAAVRMVNGRIVTDEAMDTLVDPERSIPPGSTRIHGITEERIKGAPNIDAVGRAFHHFARDAVLVAHNAPFDMAFLFRHEARIGRRFDHPVIDTVLLSAILYGQSESHTLDSLIARLGLTLDEDLRHTAMGDARITAQALERMIPMLEEIGLATLSDVIAATRKHGRLLKDLN